MEDLETLETKLKTLIAKGEMIEGQSIGDGITMSERTFDMTRDNGPVLWNEVLGRRCQNGKVIFERYYTAL